MARIYYRQEAICGTPIDSGILTTEEFDFILDNTYESKFERVDDPLKKNVWGIFKGRSSNFKTTLLSRDGITYNSMQGSFYLPNAIIFYDEEDYNFPSTFYFVAKIGNQLELRQCKGGPDVQWFQIADLHQEVTDTKIMVRVKNTLLEVKRAIESTYSKQVEDEKREKEEKKKRLREENRPYITSQQKEAYKKLAEICLNRNFRKGWVMKVIDVLKSYDTEDNRYATLSYFTERLDNEEFHFIMSLDWKADIADLEWRIRTALEDNFFKIVPIPKSWDFKENESISSPGVFEKFDSALRMEGFQLSLIDTEADEYVVLLHKAEHENEVKECIESLGFKRGHWE